jgi:hypothetical protein
MKTVFDNEPEPPRTLQFGDKTLRLIGWGRNRAVYDNGKTVVKVPMQQCGIDDNDFEAFESYRYKNKPDINGIRYARCRLLKNGYLVMEKLNTAVTYDDGPEWMDYVDCGQVGIDRKGVFKAYDYGCR